MNIQRRNSRKIILGNITIGGGAPISVQSMTNTDTRDIKSTLAQIKSLQRTGCDIVRISTPDEESVDAMSVLQKKVSIPLVADIHFNYKLALKILEQGIYGVRINPGNIGSEEKIKKIITHANQTGACIRIGINTGSLEKRIKKYPADSPLALAESALYWVKFFEDNSFMNFKVSMKSYDIKQTIEAHRHFVQKTDCPLHIGITEAGTAFSGTVRSSIGLGILLYEGIGDTIRVSLSASPEQEVQTAREILKCIVLSESGLRLIACPTCSRACYDVVKLANLIEKKFSNLQIKLKIAVMGCCVNGPGEAKNADIGFTGIKDGLIAFFEKGKLTGHFSQEEAFKFLEKKIKSYLLC